MISSLRLEALAQHHRKEKHIWDIGCDHGFLGRSFVENAHVQSINFVDPSAPVIQQLKKSLDSYISKGKFHIEQNEGQRILLYPESNLVFIAGMGGKEIQDILQAHSHQAVKETRWVISPHRNILELRRYLKNSQYRLEKEMLVEEAGRFYQVITLNRHPSSPAVHEFGSDIWQGSLGESYRNQQIAHFKQHRDELSMSYCQYLLALSL